MVENLEDKKYDLEERTFIFAKQVRELCKKLPNSISNIEDTRQVIRSSGSISANYIEANESLSKKDFIHRIKICRKEAKETILWLKLIDIEKTNYLKNNIANLIQESTELLLIFSSIINKSK
jgi:four helix bundle protein